MTGFDSIFFETAYGAPMFLSQQSRNAPDGPETMATNSECMA